MNGKKAKALRQLARHKPGESTQQLISVGTGKVTKTAINHPGTTRNHYRQLKKRAI